MYKKIFLISLLIPSITLALNVKEEKLKEFKAQEKQHNSELEKAQSDLKKEKLKELAQENHYAEYEKANHDLKMSLFGPVATAVVFAGLAIIYGPLGLGDSLKAIFGETTATDIGHVLSRGTISIGGVYTIYKFLTGVRHAIIPDYPKPDDKNN